MVEDGTLQPAIFSLALIGIAFVLASVFTSKFTRRPWWVGGAIAVVVLMFVMRHVVVP